MKSLLAASLLAATTFTAAQGPSANTPSQQVDALVALARVHGVVRYFHPSEAIEQLKWGAFLQRASERMQGAKPADIGPRLEELYAPVVEGFKVTRAGTAITPPQGEGLVIEWRHLGYGVEKDANSPYASWRTHHDPVADGKVKGSYFQHRLMSRDALHAEPVMRVALPGGMEAHVPVSLPMSATKISEARKPALDALVKTLEAVAPATDTASRAQAHADGIEAWNVARHFYPYWSTVKLDWEAQLRKWLARQPETQTRSQLRDELRRLVEPLRDGQAEVVDTRSPPPARAFLGISVRPLGGEAASSRSEQWIVDASRAAAIKPGDVLVAVGKASAATWFGERMALISGSPQHKRWRARVDLLAGEKGSTVDLRLMRGKQAIDATFTYDQPQPVQATRPPALHEIRPGIHYVDVSRVDKAAFEKALEGMKEAKGVVFDLRGYPANDAVMLASHWISRPDGAQWMFVPRFDKPYAESTTAWSIGWNTGANATLATATKVLLVDGRAIGYAESLAAYFPAHSTGPVVGEPTAGAAGNVALATLPSGLGYIFTGMRVTHHDGATTWHGVGIAPSIAVAPTIEGLRAGRDELLERAIEAAGAAPAR